MDFLSSNDFLFNLLRSCAGSMLGSFSNYFADYAESNIALVAYVSAVCRALLINQSAVQNQITALLGGVGLVNAEMNFYQSFVRLLLDKYDAVSYQAAGIWHKKLWCLTILNFYPTSDSTLVSWLPEVVNMNISLMAEYKAEEEEGRNHSSKMYSIMISSADYIEEDEEDAYSDQKYQTDDSSVVPEPEHIVTAFKSIIEKDPISTKNIQVALESMFQSMRPILGEDSYNQLIKHAEEISRKS